MSNKTKGIVRLNNKYSFRFTNNTMCELEDALDMDMSDIADMLNRGQMGWRTMRAIVWAGLLHQYEDDYGNFDLTLKEAGNVMDEFGFETTIEKVMDAFNAFLPDESEENLDKPKANREQRRAGAEPVGKSAGK